ncbi:hypothetical protein [Dyadobacter flavalbus]|nr:hypothetical protein [Dyadobacter flavalbus]
MVSFNPANLIKDNGGTQFNLKIAVGFDTMRVKSRLAKKMQRLFSVPDK